MTGLVPLFFRSLSLGFDPAAIPWQSRVVPLPMWARHDFRLWFGGTGSLCGTVKLDDVPVKKRIRLYESNTGVMLRELWTDLAGVFRIDQLSTTMYFTLTATDDTNTVGDTIYSRVQAT